MKRKNVTEWLMTFERLWIDKGDNRATDDEWWIGGIE